VYCGRSGTLQIGLVINLGDQGRFLTQYLLGLGIVGAMAAIASWVAFGPGRRTFTATVPFLGRGPASEIVGRAAFGFGAVLMYVFLAMFAVVGVGWLRRRN
jgi:hypothetical protein